MTTPEIGTPEWQALIHRAAERAVATNGIVVLPALGVQVIADMCLIQAEAQGWERPADLLRLERSDGRAAYVFSAPARRDEGQG